MLPPALSESDSVVLQFLSWGSIKQCLPFFRGNNHKLRNISVKVHVREPMGALGFQCGVTYGVWVLLPQSAAPETCWSTQMRASAYWCGWSPHSCQPWPLYMHTPQRLPTAVSSDRRWLDAQGRTSVLLCSSMWGFTCQHRPAGMTFCGVYEGVRLNSFKWPLLGSEISHS